MAIFVKSDTDEAMIQALAFVHGQAQEVVEEPIVLTKSNFPGFSPQDRCNIYNDVNEKVGKTEFNNFNAERCMKDISMVSYDACQDLFSALSCPNNRD